MFSSYYRNKAKRDSVSVYRERVCLCLVDVCFLLRQDLTVYPQLVWNSLCVPDWPEILGPPASASVSQGLGLKACVFILAM